MMRDDVVDRQTRLSTVTLSLTRASFLFLMKSVCHSLTRAIKLFIDVTNGISFGTAEKWNRC